jgi:prolyl 4-hydroxylase
MDTKTLEKDALAAVGAKVRARLAADASVYRIPTDDAEIFAISDFLSPGECERFMGLVDKTAVPSSTFEADNKQTYRTSYSGDVDPFDPFVAMVERRIDDLLGLPREFGEIVQGQRYQPGQEYQHHCDYFPPQADFYAREQPNGGQRSWTTMAYLNDVEDGGATDFPRLGVTITPRQGMLLVWNNAKADGGLNPYTIHAAKPVVQGVKYVITKWYRTRTWAPEWQEYRKTRG